MVITQKHDELVGKIQPILLPWRKMCIGIDGRDFAGKSTLGRYLSWKLEMPSVETDLFIITGEMPPTYYYDEMVSIISRRHAMDRPLIIEGVFLLETLKIIEISVDYYVYVDRRNNEGSAQLRKYFVKYETEYNTEGKSDFRFVW